MEQTSTGGARPIFWALNDPLRNWIWLGGLLALLSWAVGFGFGGYDPRLSVPLGALVGVGLARVLVNPRYEAELTMLLRMWEGAYEMLWFSAWMGLLLGTVESIGFLINALAGIVFAAIVVSMKKPYHRDSNFLYLEEETVFQRGGVSARIAAAWPVLTLVLALLVLFWRASPTYAILTIGVMLALAPLYRRPKPGPYDNFWKVIRLMTVATLALAAMSGLRQ